MIQRHHQTPKVDVFASKRHQREVCSPNIIPAALAEAEKLFRAKGTFLSRGT